MVVYRRQPWRPHGGYAAIRDEMRSVARYFGEDLLRRVRPEQFYMRLRALRSAVSDRAVLRAIHFFREN